MRIWNEFLILLKKIECNEGNLQISGCLNFYMNWLITRLLISHIVNRKTKHLQAFPTHLFLQRRRTATLCRSGRTGKTTGCSGMETVAGLIRSSRHTLHRKKDKGWCTPCKCFVLITIPINKGVDDHRQKTGNKSGEQTSPFFFQISVQLKRKWTIVSSARKKNRRRFGIRFCCCL
jgi:hypothetical protein